MCFRVYSISSVVSACLIALTFAGCGHPTAMVTASKSAPPIADLAPNQAVKLDGVPFYVKRGVCKRETIWLEPRINVDVTIAVENDVAITHHMVLTQSQFDSQAARDLLANLGVLQAASKSDSPQQYDTCKIKAQWDSLQNKVSTSNKPLCDTQGSSEKTKCTPLRDALNRGDLLLASNAGSIEVQVDYSQVYYLNTKTPWIGNASVDAKLATDGTLSEGNVQANDQTWATILNTVSSLASDLTSLGTAKIAAAPKATSTTQLTGKDYDLPIQQPQPVCTSPDWPEPSKAEVYKATVTAEIYLHDHVKYDPSINNLANCQVNAEGVTDGNVTITKKDSSGGNDKGAYKFSGQVTPPKADDNSGK